MENGSLQPAASDRKGDEHGTPAKRVYVKLWKSRSLGRRGPKTRERSLIQGFTDKLKDARTRRSREVGLAMLAVSVAFFALSFITRYLLFEVSSLTAFVLGVILLVSDAEQHIRLYSAAAALEGPVRTIVLMLRDKGWTGTGVFVPEKYSVKVRFATRGKANDPILIEPYGEGLFAAYQSEIGDIANRGREFAITWIPRVLVDALGLAEKVKMATKDTEVTTTLVRPFVRPLCVMPFFTENVCNTMGCPLINSIGHALAVAEGKEVSHVKCTYDPLTQTAVATHRVAKEEESLA